MIDRATATKASQARKIDNITEHTVYASFRSLAATKISALTVKLQGSELGTDDTLGVITDPTLVIGSTAERVANSAFDYLINGTTYSKAAVAAGSVFTAAHIVSATKFGVILLYINTAGAISSKVPLATQAYATAALAHTAADTIAADANICYIGRILINAGAGAWTANTDDMTAASDLTTATFLSETSTFIDLASHAFSAAEITAQKAMFHVSNKGIKYTRLYLSTLTGTGEVTATWTYNIGV